MTEGPKFGKLKKLMTNWEHPNSLQISTRCKAGEERHFRMAQRTRKSNTASLM